MSFEYLGLSNSLLRAIADQNYIKPTPIQERAIPVILSGKDVMGGAQTGTGKTASFVLPTLHRLEIHANSSTSPAKHPIRALILVPTRELAIQVYDSIRAYGKYLSLKSAVIYGGTNIDPQISVLQSGVEILVATPGRLLDHIQQKNIVLSKVEVFILDEADRMLDMGFMPDIKQIIQLLPSQRQNLMFSATFSEEIKKLANNILIKPVLVEVAKQNSTSELVTHIVYAVEVEKKKELLTFLIESRQLNQVLIFTKTKINADYLTKHLNNCGIKSLAIHGDRNQSQRLQALNSFKDGHIKALVATDVAARGIDIDSLACVINFELPKNPEDYIHRIGRTGRAGEKGYAISLVSQEDDLALLSIEKLLKASIKRENLCGFGNDLNSSSLSLENKPFKNVKSINSYKSNAKKNESMRSNKTANQVTFKKAQSAKLKSDSQKTAEDSIFFQPYIPQSFENKSVLPKESNSSLIKVNKRYNKSLPALFISKNTTKEHS